MKVMVVSKGAILIPIEFAVGRNEINVVRYATVPDF